MIQILRVIDAGVNCVRDLITTLLQHLSKFKIVGIAI